MKRLVNINDYMFLALETRQSMMHTAGVLIFQIPENYEGNFVGDLMEDLERARQPSAPFNLRLETPFFRFGLPSWVEDRSFDLNYHLRHSALPAPGTMEQFKTLISRLHGIMMDRNRPLWEFHVIEGIEGNRYAIYFKTHHSQFDGVSGMDLLKSPLSCEREGTYKPFWEIKQQRWGGEVQFADLWARLESMPVNAALQFLCISQLTRLFFKLGLQKTVYSDNSVPFPYSAVKTRFNQEISAQRRFDKTSFNLREIKQIGWVLGATVNDVMLTVCSGALRRYLKEYQDLPDASLIAFVPMALPERKDRAGANRITGVLCNLGTDREDHLERFEVIRKSMARNKSLIQSLSDNAAEQLVALSQGPAFFASALGIAHKFPLMPFNIVISNIPGPRGELYFNGARLESLIPVSALTHGQGLNITLMSHGNVVDAGLLGCRKTVPDIDRLTKYLEDAFSELKHCVARSKKYNSWAELADRAFKAADKEIEKVAS